MTTAGEAAHQGVTAGAVQKKAELSRLIEIVAARFTEPDASHRLDRPIRILEIGSYLGGTLAAWRTMWPDAFVVAVDLPDPPERPIVAHGAHLIVGDSHSYDTAALVSDRLHRGSRGEETPGGCDLLFVDGDHSLEGVTQDLELYGPMVNDGGLLAMHDVVPFNEGKSPPLGAELVWKSLDRWCHSTVRDVGDHWESDPVWERIGEIIDRGPQPDGRAPWWGGIGVAVKL